MRFLARALGLFLAAGTFVAVMVDGTRSIADNQILYLSVRGFWSWLNAASLARAQAWVEAYLSAFVLERIALPVLELPFACLTVALAVLFLWLGRKPASRIGYVSHL
jgi:hypothetical protein